MQSINLLQSFRQAQVKDAQVSFRVLSIPFTLDFETEDVANPKKEAHTFKNYLHGYTAEQTELEQLLSTVETENELVILTVSEKSFIADFEAVVNNFVVNPDTLAWAFALALRCTVGKNA